MKVPSAKSPIRKASRVTPKEAEAKAKENEFLRDGISHLLLVCYFNFLPTVCGMCTRC